MKWFRDIKTLEGLKKAYKQLAMKHHPDRGGYLQDMKEINSEYDKEFKRLKDTHMNKDGKVYTANSPSEETPGEYRDIINALINAKEIDIEICGSFVWVSGNTKPIKETLKKLGFKWSQNKQAWYLKPSWYHRRSHKAYSMEEIRDMYGSQKVGNSSRNQILKATN